MIFRSILTVVLSQILISFAFEKPLELFDVEVILEQYHMYRGEFPCYEHNVSGLHDLLRFGFWVCNPNSEAVWLDETERFVTARIDSNQDVNVSLPFLRDTWCLDSSPFYSRGCDFTLGKHCCALIPLRTPCTWIDVTNETLPDSFTLHLSLAGHGNISESFTGLEAKLRAHSLFAPLTAPIAFLTVFLLCLVRIQCLKKDAEKRATRVAL
jgi:hypothetical protein